jgi:hypothetical protein
MYIKAWLPNYQVQAQPLTHAPVRHVVASFYTEYRRKIASHRAVCCCIIPSIARQLVHSVLPHII